MTQNRKRMMAFGLLGAGALAFLAVMIPIESAKFQSHQARLESTAVDRARFVALSGSQQNLESEIAALETAIASETSIITAPSRPAAQDQFLSRVRAAITSRNGQIRTFELTPPVSGAALERLGAVVTFDVSEEGFADLLAELEGRNGRVYVRELNVAATPDGVDPTASPILSIRATLVGLARIEASS
jgi:hypothetical protein